MLASESASSARLTNRVSTRVGKSGATVDLPLQAFGKCVALGGGGDGGPVRRHPDAAPRQLARQVGNDRARGVYDEAEKIGGDALGARDDAAAQRARRRDAVVVILLLAFSAQADLLPPPDIAV